VSDSASGLTAAPTGFTGSGAAPLVGPRPEGDAVMPQAARTTGPETRRLSPARLADHTDRLFRAAYALCGSRAEAEDLVQETFVKTLERPRFVRRGDLAYLMRVLRNTWIDFQRARAARPVATGPTEAIDWVVDRRRDPGELALDVQLAYDAMRRLPPPQREAVAAVDVLGLSYRDAARALRIPEGTLMSRLYRARNRIADALEG
jgi:RNA polymerase sigma-70 factor, ECF subfamily